MTHKVWVAKAKYSKVKEGVEEDMWVMVQITTFLTIETTKTPNWMEQQGGTTFKERKKGKAEHVKWMVGTNLKSFNMY
jgi:hypothetical protein